QAAVAIAHVGCDRALDPLRCPGSDLRQDVGEVVGTKDGARDRRLDQRIQVDIIQATASFRERHPKAQPQRRIMVAQRVVEVEKYQFRTVTARGHLTFSSSRTTDEPSLFLNRRQRQATLSSTRASRLTWYCSCSRSGPSPELGRVETVP